MEISKIKSAALIVEKLEEVQQRIKELERTTNVDCVTIRRHQSGAPEYSYEVTIANDDDFLSTIRTLIIDRLRRDEKKLIAQIESC